MEGTYRSIYKKNAQRDGCLLSNLRFTVEYTNLPPEIGDYHRRFYSLPGVALVSEFDLENGIRQEKHMSIKLE